MDLMKWLRWIGSAATPARKAPASEPRNEAAPDESTTTAQDVDLRSQAVMADALQCARHALVMEFRTKHRFDPTQEDLADWANSIWLDRDQVRTIIRNRNPMALSLGERFDAFWPELKRITASAKASP